MAMKRVSPSERMMVYEESDISEMSNSWWLSWRQKVSPGLSGR